LDVKKLGRIGRVSHRITGDRRHRARGIGWEYVHVAVDDASRLAYVEVLPDERGATVARFLWRALAWFSQRGIRVHRVMTDNAFAYLGRASLDCASSAASATCASARTRRALMARRNSSSGPC
jgi:hypothetical protein